MSEPIAVLGAGAWGTALAIAAAARGPVRLWARDPARAAAIAAARENARLLPGARLPAGVEVTADAYAALSGAAFAILAVPAQPLASVLAGLPEALPPLIVAAKGVEQGTLRLPLETVSALRPGLPAGGLTGPTFAHEVAAGLPAAALVASADPAVPALVLPRLGSGLFRLYAGDDPVGAQVGGAAKNVVAIAAGAVIGAGFGENARAALVTRGLAEIGRLAVALGGRRETVAGLSGLGDLLLTCTGEGSRNYSLGVALGRGLGLAETLAARTGVTEGVPTAPALLARASAAGVEMPIVSAVAAVLAGEASVAEAMRALMARPPKAEG
ncbi:MAG: NAD(P)H-dependent glycerol-3-phosphate dehydrogenase [Acetobacteraceae bacterium]|nr:NAD(P)H-dependent glycerol-3-phosphate dehydrogenase [Acetobacteraceae bacterium]